MTVGALRHCYHTREITNRNEKAALRRSQFVPYEGISVYLRVIGRLQTCH